MRAAAPRTLAGLALAATLAAVSPSVAAQDGGEDARVVTTRHRVVVDGRPLDYEAHAGLIPLRHNEAGEVRARVFFTAYTRVDGAADASPRPLTFVWNGGPGMNSSLIHLLGFGPRRVRTGDTYPDGRISETELEDNQETWLDLTDLVFVDPPGTGYSRPARAEWAADFYQTPGDTEAVAEFIRVFRARYDAWDRPLFIVGHSYGTTRAMGVSDALRRRGVPLHGVVLMAGGISVGQAPLPEALETALAVPGMAAAAFHHRRLAPGLQRDLDATLEEARAWAVDTYAPALARVDALTAAEREEVLRGLARYTGLRPDALDAATLVVERNRFKTRLLEGRLLGNYDYRMTRPADPGEDEDTPYDIFRDPSFAPAVPLVQGTSPLLNRYFRSDLGFESDLLYQGPLGGGWPPAEGINRRWVRRPAGSDDDDDARPPLRRAMDANPALRVFLVRGLYDSLGSGCARHVHTVEALEPDLRRRVSVACYGAGHDMYTDRAVRRAIKRDITEFLQRTLAEHARQP